ncbi:MAG: DUF362 domain-containing protein [Nitrospirae bacterium]|nr:DUF362 domain-containing protein [Nitrospirota bacterium]MBF0534696.1 DUF362 domain-containing protein [Nitrospirota bacterium]MBF0616260.1 DUF362 domain-containing protein [Nitrospirota bacterium]
MKEDNPNSKNVSAERRNFLKACALSLGVAAAGVVFYSKEPVKRQEGKIHVLKDHRVVIPDVYPKLCIVHGKDVLKMVTAAVEKLGGMSKFVEKGQRVFIKPNVGWDRQPEIAANTNPEVVAAVVTLCLSAGAREVWVTDVSINDPYRSFARSGIEPAVLKAGGKVKIPTENDFLYTDLKGEILKVWPVVSFLHQADRVINIPVLKHHSLSKCTLSMKNWYGILGGKRNRLHQEINISISDLASAVRPTLTVMDATRVLKRNGPTGGNLADVSAENTIIAGTDEVAIDACCLKYLDLKTGDVAFLKIAEVRGTGTSDWKNALRHEEFSV